MFSEVFGFYNEDNFADYHFTYFFASIRVIHMFKMTTPLTLFKTRGDFIHVILNQVLIYISYRDLQGGELCLFP